MSVSGTYRPPNSPSLPHRPWASGSRMPGSAGRGPKGSAGRSRRAARARLTNMATRTGSLGGRPRLGSGAPGRDPGRTPTTGRAPRRPPYRHRSAGTVEQRVADVLCLETTREDDRDTGRHRGRHVRGGTLTGPAGHRRVGRVQQDGPQVGLGQVRLGLGQDLRGGGATASVVPAPIGGRWSALMTGSGIASSASGGSAPCNWTASRPRRAAIAATSGGVPVGEDADQLWAAARGGGQPGQPDECRNLGFREGPLRARHHVQADGVGARGDGRRQAARFRDAADLDQRQRVRPPRGPGRDAARRPPIRMQRRAP